MGKRLKALAAALLLFALPSSLATSIDTWYASDSSGEKISEIGAFRRDEFRYTLLVRTLPREGGSIEERVLHEEGRPTRSWKTVLTVAGIPVSEELFIGGDLSASTLFDRAGRIEKEMAYVSGVAVREISYRYDGARLRDRTERDGSGNTVAIDHYRYDSIGRLLEMRRESPTPGMALVVGMSARRDGSYSTWSFRGKSGELTFADTKGRLARKETWAGGLLVEILSMEYRGDTRVAMRSTLSNPERKTLAVSLFDEEGRLIEETFSKDDSRARLVAYEYGENGRLASKRTDTKGSPTERSEYAYEPDGSLSSETVFVDGALAERRIFPQDYDRIVEYFYEGFAFVRTYFKDGRKVLEEFLDGGRVVRTRKP